LVEADTPTEFERGVRGLAIRVAKAVNRALGAADECGETEYVVASPSRAHVS